MDAFTLVLILVTVVGVLLVLILLALAWALWQLAQQERRSALLRERDREGRKARERAVDPWDIPIRGERR